ncbi:Six-hairpin glycosidase-like protein [Leptodontidium sp. 2 PMI_412]|nr:Six-hairpin glycosidase-like protein [Leptodontidium sp. 2 PMI_412]
MELLQTGNTWIWHPDWVDAKPDSAGGFLHFRKTLHHHHPGVTPAKPITINISADTRYKLYINKQFVHGGPVKGDERRWFYDTVDVTPFLRDGDNHIAVHVLRFYHATTYAWPFARMPIGGLFIQSVDQSTPCGLNTDDSWETAIDPSAELRVGDPFDVFMQIFERVDRRRDEHLTWTRASVVVIPFEGVGLTSPWRLCPRMIPHQRRTPLTFHALHNVRSTVGAAAWEALLLPHADSTSTAAATGLEQGAGGLRLPSNSTHHLELEVEAHKTTLLAFRFLAEAVASGTKLTITYSECYEDEPHEMPFSRCKGDRTDTTKMLIGPYDSYTLSGGVGTSPCYTVNSPREEVYQPFHYRTFRYLTVDIEVPANTEVTCVGFDVVETRYPLEVEASFGTGDEWVSKFWSISVRTLENCMHDCYEDCPFYEQLQYSLDTRSSSLFTYLLSADDRLARQAIVQIHDSFNPSIGLTASRSTDSIMMRQYIIPFALYWICMVTDHYEYYADAAFARRFLGVAESILETFASQIGSHHGLITSPNNAAWEFTDWTTPWAKTPPGVPPAVGRTGVSTYINCLYAYTLKALATLHEHLGRRESALGFRDRADAISNAVSLHCFDGEFFTDGLAQVPVPANEYSQHSQVWAVLSGAATGTLAERILRESLANGDPDSQRWIPSSASQTRTSLIKHERRLFTMTSISFSFYTLRAAAAVGGAFYDEHFPSFWTIWNKQVAQNVTTWAEDSVGVRSDCHAWGSVPIYEFVAEVAGIKPAAPGFSKVAFQPRLRLFPHLNMTVPVGGINDKLIEINWERLDDETIVSLRNRTRRSGTMVLVVVRLPDRGEFTAELRDTLEYHVRNT